MKDGSKQMHFDPLESLHTKDVLKYAVPVRFFGLSEVGFLFLDPESLPDSVGIVLSVSKCTCDRRSVSGAHV